MNIDRASMRAFIRPLFLLLIYLAAQTAATGLDYSHQRWNALWIRVPGSDPVGYGVYHFRRKFALDHPRDHLRVFVSADNRYQLFLNGELVSVGPARSDLFHWRYETVDLGPKLRAGANVLAAVVWNEGQGRAVAQPSHATGFLLQAEDPADWFLNSGKTWRGARDSAYSPQIVPKQELVGYTALGPNERVDAAAYPWSWETLAFDDANWPLAEEVSPGAPRTSRDAPNPWMLTPSPIAPEERTPVRFETVRHATGVQPPAAFPRDPARFEIPPNTHASLLLDQSFLVTAYPELIVSGGKGSTIRLHYSEALYEAAGGSKLPPKGNRNQVEGKLLLGRFDTFLPDGGDNRLFRPLFWRTYRYLQLEADTGNAPLLVEDIRGIFTAYPFQRTASVRLSDPQLDSLAQRILDTGWRTARLCAHETYMDCPYYEQLQYAGDARIQMLVSLYNTGDASLMRNGIEAINSSRTADGLTYSRAPSSLPQYIPPFSLWWIGMVHDYWMYVDDPDFVRSMLPGVESILRFFSDHQKGNGSLRALPWWNFVDWTATWHDGVSPADPDGSSSAAVDLQLVLAFEWASDLEKALGDEQLASRYKAAAGKLRRTVRETDWDPARRIFADQPAHQTYSQQVNTLAVLADVLPVNECRDVLLRALNEPSIEQSSIYFQAYNNEALTKAGEGGNYFERLGP
ncbi:MAG: hypothetical protein JO217_04670, partial [Acidobacteriaceae bacterium]|nr:hypothetical protein [Acidobacteriaceae bacterium]